MKLFCRFLLIILFLALFPNYGTAKTQPQKKIDLIINGIKGKALENIKSRLTLKKNVIYAQQPDIVKWRYYLDIPNEVRAAIEPFGYFKAKIKTHLIRSPNLWQITVDVIPGPRLKFTHVIVTVTGEGKNDNAFKNYLQHLPISVGRNFNSDHYERTKDTLQDIANARGYFKSNFITNKLIVNLQNYTSEAIIEFDTGPRYRFGETEFSPTPFNINFLKRYLTYKPLQPYSNRLLERSRSNLSSSNYFQQVVMIPEIDQASNLVVPIKTNLTPQDQVLYSFGAGYGTDTGPRALATMDLRWLNSWGHSMNALLRGSTHNSTVAANYVIPGFKPYKEFYTFSAGFSELFQVSGKGHNTHGSFMYQNMFHRWRFTAGLTYLIEKYQLNNFPISGTNTNTNTQLLYPSVTLQKTYAKKNILNPLYGYNIAFSGAGASQALGSRSSFSQVRLDTKFLYTINKTHTRLLPRVSLGYTSINNLSSLPLSMQFYAGGFSSVRGFLFNQIGPGRILAIGSMELQQKIYGNFYLAGFIDAGLVTNTGPNNPPFFKQRWDVGAGPGLVYLSPIGTVELTVAKVLNASNTSTNPFIKRIGKWTVQFGFGVVL